MELKESNLLTDNCPQQGVCPKGMYIDPNKE